MRPLQTYRKQAVPPMTACLPVVRREGSRPLLAALRQRQPIWTAISSQSPRPHLRRINVRARRALPIYYLLFLIYYLDCPSGALSSPMVHPALLFNNAQNKKQPYFSVRLYFGAQCGRKPEHFCASGLYLHFFIPMGLA